jgi:hypothetical protein
MKNKDLVEDACTGLDVKRTLPDIGDPVRVNMNLNRGCIAVKAGSGEHRGKVLFYTEAPVTLQGAEFRILDSVYQKIQNEGARDVCAYVKGRLRGFDLPDAEPQKIHYNPMRQKHFHLSDGTPVKSAEVFRAWVPEDARSAMTGFGIETLAAAD